VTGAGAAPRGSRTPRALARRGWLAGLLVGVVAVAVAVAVAAAGLAAAAPVAGGKVGRRITVAVYGDSVVEAYTIPGYLRHGFVPALGAAVARAGGFEPGGAGLIPMTPFRWRFNRYTVFGGERPAAGGWVLAGYASHSLDGPSGYSALATSPQASATAPIDAPDVAVLFTKFAGAGRFTVTAGASSWTIDAGSTGPPAPTEAWLTMPAGARTITVHGPSGGSLVLDGVISRRPVTAGRVQLEMENLGHMGHTLSDDSEPRIAASLTAQRFDVSVFAADYIYQYSAQYDAPHRTRHEADYVGALRAHAGRVRAYGGLCLIADSSPVPLGATVLAQFAAIDRREARSLGCAYTSALGRLWNPATAVREGLTLIDGSHPTGAGYARIAAALTPAVLRLVRARLRGGG
jgi:hypothetical protein